MNAPAPEIPAPASPPVAIVTGAYLDHDNPRITVPAAGVFAAPGTPAA